MTHPISRLYAVALILQMFIASMTNKTAISFVCQRFRVYISQGFMLFLHRHSLAHKGILQVPGLSWEQNIHLYFIVIVVACFTVFPCIVYAMDPAFLSLLGVPLKVTLWDDRGSAIVRKFQRHSGNDALVAAVKFS
jgi:hypothetical protein